MRFRNFLLLFLVTFFNALDFLKFFEYLSKNLRRFFKKELLNCQSVAAAFFCWQIFHAQKLHKFYFDFVFFVFYVHKATPLPSLYLFSLSQQNCWTIFYAYLTYRSFILFASTVFLLPYFSYILLHIFTPHYFSVLFLLFKQFYSTCSCVHNFNY